MSFRDFDAACRLCAYRKELAKTPEQMADSLGVSQNYYRKLESGEASLSRDSLRRVYEQGGDVEYLITGAVHAEGGLDSFYGRCISAKEKREFFKIAVWTIRQGIAREGNRPDMMAGYRRIQKLLDGGERGRTLWERIRRNEGISQEEMAKRLGIHVRRFRGIEKRSEGADAQVLGRFYRLWGYSPMLALDEEIFFLDELNRLWDALAPETRERLGEFLEHAVRMMEKRNPGGESWGFPEITDSDGRNQKSPE